MNNKLYFYEMENTRILSSPNYFRERIKAWPTSASVGKRHNVLQEVNTWVHSPRLCEAISAFGNRSFIWDLVVLFMLTSEYMFNIEICGSLRYVLCDVEK